MIRKLLLDIDGTLLDFDASAKIAIEKVFSLRGWQFHEDVFTQYIEINNALWQRHENGELSRSQLLVERFDILLGRLGIVGSGKAFEDDFREILVANPVLIEGAREILDYLRPKYELYVVSNGVAASQVIRLKGIGIDHYFTDTFYSETIGAQKPQPAFFDYVLSHIDPHTPEEILLIGDNLNADILGANQAGIPCCWFNPANVMNLGPARPDYIIRELSELKNIL